MSELRLYTFINFYLSSIQQGIQTAHLVHELFTSYTQPGEERQRLYDWATNHKTIITLNGGANDDIQSKFLFFMREARSFEFPAPFAAFNEDSYSLGGVMTGCAIVLPEEIYDAVPCKAVGSNFEVVHPSQANAWCFIKDDQVKKVWTLNSPEARLLTMLKSCSLAK